jgi:hypothetical protein
MIGTRTGAALAAAKARGKALGFKTRGPKGDARQAEPLTPSALLVRMLTAVGHMSGHEAMTMWKGIAIGVALVVESAFCASAQTPAQSKETKRTLTRQFLDCVASQVITLDDFTSDVSGIARGAVWCPTFALAWRLPGLRQVLRRCSNRGRQCVSSRFLARRLRRSRGRGQGRSKSRPARPHLSSSGCVAWWRRSAEKPAQWSVLTRV